MELKKEILIDNKEYVLEKAYPSYVLYHRKQFPNIRTCILWQDIYRDQFGINLNEGIRISPGAFYGK